MHRFVSPACALMAVLALGQLPARAESVVSATSSAASTSFAVSVGSVSESFGASSRSSRAAPQALAPGEFRVTEVTAAPRAGRVQLMLQPADAHNRESFTLELPEAVLAQAPLAVGDTVAATPRPFGVEFARGAPRQAFFLVLKDDWLRELGAKPLG